MFKTKENFYRERKSALICCLRIALCACFAQDPIIFSGNVRDNLDPFGDASSDADMWAALKQAGLKKTVRSLPVRLCLELYVLIAPAR